MICVFCTACGHGLRISPGDDGELESLFGEWHPNKYPCFNCGEAAQVVEAIDSTSVLQFVLHDVTAGEAFAAMNGLGLPQEQECSPAAVEKLFSERTVKRAKTRVIRNSHRCVIDFLEFDDGSRLYLGSSSVGAVVYRISSPHSYAQQVRSG